MVRNNTVAKRETVWANILFFGGVHLAALIGVPLYIMSYGFNPADLYLAIFFWLATGLSITVGYHRLFSHRAYNTQTAKQLEVPRKQLRLLSKNAKMARKRFEKAHKDWKEFSGKVFELPKISPSLQGLLA